MTKPLRQMFRRAGRRGQDPATLRAYRDALRLVLHENVHLLASEGHWHADARIAYGDHLGVRAIEESITELYSHQRLNAYIDELGLEEIAPGIKAVSTPKVYQHYLPAAEMFATSVGSRTGIGPDELIRRMAVESADQKFTVVARAVFDTSDLPDRVPSAERAAAVARIAEAMRLEFAKLESVPADAAALVRAMTGVDAARAAYGEVRALRRQWAQPAQPAVDERTLRVGLGGVAAIPSVSPPRGSRPDGARSDAGRSDGDRSDGSRFDAGRPDGSRSDAGRSHGGRYAAPGRDRRGPERGPA